MSDLSNQYIEWLLRGRQGMRPGAPQPDPDGMPPLPPRGAMARPQTPGPTSQYAPPGMPPYPTASQMPPEAMPEAPPALLPAAAAGGGGGIADAAGATSAGSPWMSMLAPAAAALYSQDLNSGEDQELASFKNVLFGPTHTTQMVKDPYASKAPNTPPGDKVIAAKQAPAPKAEEEAPATTPQVKNLMDLRVLQRLMERKQLQQNMGLTPPSDAERMQSETAGRPSPGSMQKRMNAREAERKQIKDGE